MSEGEAGGCIAPAGAPPGPATMVNFHNRVSVKARESWKKLKTLHGFLKKATVVTDAPLSKDEAQYESRIEDTVEALNGNAAAYGNLEEFYTPEVSQPLEYQPIWGQP